MSDENILLTAQEDITFKLLSEDVLATVNIIPMRKLLTDSVANIAAACFTSRGGKIGTAIIVGMPFIEDERKETGISEGTLCIPIYCLEHPDSAQLAISGSLKTAEEVAVTARRLLRGFVIEGKTTLFTEGRSIVPTEPPPENEDVISYELTVKGRLRQAPDTRCGLPTISEASLTVTLANVTSGAIIYYTIDGTFPGSPNTAALIYSTPFVVTSGTVVRWAAYKTGLSGSITGQGTIT